MNYFGFYQELLVSGGNIKTLASQSLLGSGDISEIANPFSFKATSDAATLGTELTTNGTFTGGAAEWSLGTGWAYGTDNVILTLAGGGEGNLAQTTIAVTNGYAYIISWSQTHSAANNCKITPRLGAVNGKAISYEDTTAHTQTQLLTATTTGTVTLSLVPSVSASGTVTIDTVSVQLITPMTAILNYKNIAGTIKSSEIITSADGNFIKGYNANRYNTTGNGINALGYDANYSNTTGNYINALGYDANYSNTTGNGINALGYRANYSNTTGSYINALGREANYSNTTGNYINALGREANYYNTTGSSINALGYRANYSNTTGSYINSLGYRANYSNTTGNYINALGYDANYSNTTGSYINALGYRANYSNTTGSYINALGREANYYNTTGSFINSLGYQANKFIADGTTPSTIQNYSIFIGSNTRPLADNQTDQIVIGDSAIGHGSYTVTIGNTSNTANYLVGKLNIANIPTSAVGLSSGDIWSNSGVLTIVS